MCSRRYERMNPLNPSSYKILVRGSLLLNIFLVLYISLLYGWNLTNPILSKNPPPSRSIQFFNGHECEPNITYEERRRPEPVTSVVSSRIVSSGFREVSPGVSCFDKELRFRQGQRGKFWVLYNYIPANQSFRCNETITYTTHGDFTFMDNLEPLLLRWQGPVSLSVYAPGTDFEKSVSTILYYRDCRNNTLVKDFVTFHLFFDLEFIPEVVPQYSDLLLKSGDCTGTYNWGEGYKTFKKEKKLNYHVNVARNVARETAQTHFIFPSDIELYPSPGLIPSFLEMVKQDVGPGSPDKPRVYVNSIFEIQKGHELPSNKSELLTMLKEGTVIPFHKKVCPLCHNIPFAKDWTKVEVTGGMNVLHVGKRQRPFHHWEPIYIGTNKEPLYDERLTWEGRSDKMTQGYKLCVLDYEFHILDNAFLIHRPGIKTQAKVKTSIDNAKVAAQNKLIKSVITPQVKKLYGERQGCEMW